MTSWTSYPKIFSLGHRAIVDLFTRPVLIEEKIDGSQFSFGMFDGELRMKSKQVEFPADAPAPMFVQAAEAVKARAHLLHDGFTYRGEYLSKPKHNALAYNRVPEGTIIIFDINPGHEFYLDVYAKRLEAERIGLETVPSFGVFEDVNLELIQGFMDTESILGGPKIEGVVIKSTDLYGPDKKLLMAKHVSEAFKEVHRKEWKTETRQDVVELIIGRFRTDARWEKAVQHLRDAGALEDSPRDIGPLVREAMADLHEECRDEIAGILYGHFKGKILKGSVRGLPEWYKGTLLSRQFPAETPDAVSQ